MERRPGAPRPKERNGVARSRGPLGSPSASANETGQTATPGSWIQAANWKPRTPAWGHDSGHSPSCTSLTAQPTRLLEPVTDDGPVCPPTQPDLGSGGDTSPALGRLHADTKDRGFCRPQFDRPVRRSRTDRPRTAGPATTLRGHRSRCVFHRHPSQSPTDRTDNEAPQTE